MAFKAFYYNQLNLPLVLSSTAISLALFVFDRKFMLNKVAELIRVKRLLGIFLVQVYFLESYAKWAYADNYRVNINNLLDQDEKFLFANQEFRRIIKTVCTEHDYLINPNFDVDVKCKLPAFPKKDNQWIEEGHQTTASTFNCGLMSTSQAYIKMI
jgi:hypothetical protein